MTSDYPKLPAWRTAYDSYRITLQNIGPLIRLAWPWMIAAALIQGGAYWIFYTDETTAALTGKIGSLPLMAVNMLVSTGIGAIIAVPWHRLILIGENDTNRSGATITQRTGRYFALALALMLLSTLCIVPAYLIPDEAPTDEGTALGISLAIFASLVMILLFAIVPRISLALPARALDRNEIGFVQSWRMTRGNTWRLITSGLLVTLPYIVFAIATAFSSLSTETGPKTAAQLQSRAAFALQNGFWEAASLFVGMVFVTLLSLTYKHFAARDHSAAKQ